MTVSRSKFPYVMIAAAGGGITFVLAMGVGAALLFLGDKLPPAGQNSITGAGPQTVSAPPPAAPDATQAQASAAAVQASAQSPATSGVVRLKAPAQAFAMNHHTRDLAAVSAKTAELYVYSPEYQETGNGKVIGPVRAGNLPVTITFKRYKDKSYYIVGDLNESKLRLFDSTTLEPSGEINLGTRNVISVSSPRYPDSPHLFYTGSSRDDLSFSAGRASLATMSDEGLFAEELVDVEAPVHGDFVYGRSSSVRLVRFRDGGVFAPLKCDILHGKNERSHPVLADPYDSWVIAYKSAMPLVGRSAGTFEFTPLCFVANRPFVAGVRDQELCLASLNGLKPRSPSEASARGTETDVLIPTVARLPIPKDVLPEPVPPDRKQASRRPWFVQNVVQHSIAPDQIHDEFRLFSSPRGDRLVLVHRDALFSTSLTSLSLPAEPLLSAAIGGPSEIMPGDNWNAKVEVQEGVEVSLVEAPPGMTLSSGLLTWTPSTEQVGQFTVAVELTGGGFTDRQQRQIRVVRPRVACSFPTDRLEISHDGRLALALGQPPPPHGREFDPLRKTRVAVVDLVNLKVVAEREVGFPVLLAAIDEHYVYVTSTPFRTRDCELLVLSRENLAELHRYPIVIDRGTKTSSAPAITSLGGRFLIADTVRSLPDLKPILPEELQSHSALGRVNLLALHRPLTDGWLFEGIVYDKEFQKIQLLRGYRDPSSTMRLAGIYSGTYHHRFLSPWNLTWEGDDGRYTTTMFVSDLGQRASDLPTQFSANVRSDRMEARRILDDIPVLVTFGSDEKDPFTVVTAHCLGDSRLLGEWPVAPYPLKPDKYDALTTHVAVAGRTAAVALAGMIYVVPLAGLDDQPLKEPPHFLPRQSQFVLAAKGPTKLQYTIRGGTPPYRQITERGQPASGGFTSGDGSVEIELNWESLLRSTKEEFVRLILEEGRRRQAARQSGASPGRQGFQADRILALEALDDYQPQVTQLLRQAGGAPLSGVPIPYRVGLYAQDAEGKTFGLAHWVFGVVPLKDMRSVIEPDAN